MRIITGDECGLLKEVIPELCRPSLLGGSDDKSSSMMAIHAGRARPSATSIQAAAASYGNYNNSNNTGLVGGGKSVMEQRAIQRIESNNNDDIAMMSRERGIVSLAFLPPNNSTTRTSNNDDDDDSNHEVSSSSFKFAALRMNGIVETWCGNRVSNQSDGEEEVNVTAALYAKQGLVNSVLPSTDDESSDNDDNDGNNNNNNGEEKNTTTTGNKGWYTNQPIRPMGMVSNYNQSSTQSNNNNPILATLDSIGNITILNPNNLSLGVVSTYNAFLTNDDSQQTTMKLLPTPSSSKNDSNSLGTLTYTKGRFANNHIATCLAIGGDGNKLAVGGRERGMRVLDLESGKLLWKVSHKMVFVFALCVCRHFVLLTLFILCFSPLLWWLFVCCTNTIHIISCIHHNRLRIFHLIHKHCCNNPCGLRPSNFYTLQRLHYHLPLLVEEEVVAPISWPPAQPTSRYKYMIFVHRHRLLPLVVHVGRYYTHPNTYYPIA